MAETLICEVRETFASLNPGFDLVYVIFLPEKNASTVDIILVQHTNNIEKYLTVGLVFRWITNMPVSLAGPSVMQVCIPDGRPHRVTYTRYRIDTVNSPEDGHIVARNV